MEVNLIQFHSFSVAKLRQQHVFSLFQSLDVKNSLNPSDSEVFQLDLLK